MRRVPCPSRVESFDAPSAVTARTLALAVAQTTPRRGDVDANIDQHSRLARLAAEAGAKVLVFPELSLTGYEMELAADLAFSEEDPRLDPLLEAATSLSIALVVGAPVRIGACLHIAAFIASPDGSLALYTKHHLGAFPDDANPGGRIPPAEDTVFQPGDRNPLLDLKGCKAALAVCADWMQPSHVANAAARGAAAYLVGTFTIPRYLETVKATLERYAIRHLMTVVFANHGGATGGLPAGGRSAIWSERGERLVELPPAGAGIALALQSRDSWHTRSIVLE